MHVTVKRKILVSWKSLISSIRRGVYSKGEVREIILATSSTVEGEATAGYLASIAQQGNIRVSRIAHGVPIGGELEYVDRSTLSRAIAGRNLLELE